MTTTAASVGQTTQGRLINLGQLQAELATASVDTSQGLGQTGDFIHTYSQGEAADFPTDQQASVDQCIGAHVAMRNKTSEEYAAEFQDPETAPARKQEIRDIQNGLLPPEQVPMEPPG